VIDANLGNYQRGVVRSDIAACDVHLRAPA